MEKPNVLQGLANPANYDFPEGLCLPSSFQEGKNRRKKRGGFYCIQKTTRWASGSKEA